MSYLVNSRHSSRRRHRVSQQKLIYSHNEFNKQQRNDFKLDALLTVHIHQHQVIYTLHSSHLALSKKRYKKSKAHRCKRGQTGFIQSAVLQYVLNEWQCLRTNRKKLGYNAGEIFKNIMKICDKFPRTDYYYRNIVLSQTRKHVFFLFQKCKSKQNWYGYIVDNDDVHFGVSLRYLLSKMWNDIRNIGDINQIIDTIKHERNINTKYKRKNLCIPQSIMFTVKHLSSRKYYRNISPFTPQKISVLVHRYINELKMNVPDCIGSMVCRFHGVIEYDFKMEYLENGNVIIHNNKASLASNCIFFVDFELRFDIIYVLRVRIIVVGDHRCDTQRIVLGIKQYQKRRKSICMSVRNEDTIEMVIHFKRKMMEFYINDTYYQYISLIKEEKIKTDIAERYKMKISRVIANDNEAALYFPFVDMCRLDKIEMYT